MQTSIKNGFNKQLGQQEIDFAASFGPFIGDHKQRPKPAPKEPPKPQIPHLKIAPAAGQYVQNGVNQNPQEVKYLTHLMSQMEKTDKGREILTTLSKAGYSVALDYTSEYGGYCCPQGKTLYVNPYSRGPKARSNNSVLSTLIHESEHGLQDVKGLFPTHYNSQNLQSTLMIQRFSEAAADLAGIDTAFQMGGKAWEEQKSDEGSRIGMAYAYEMAYNETGDPNEARRACVKEWFVTSNGRFPDVYAKNIARFFESELKNGRNIGDDSKYYTTKSLADFYLRGPDGKPLFDDPEKEFAHPIYCGITKEARTAMNTIYAARKQMFGIEPDRSLVNIPESPIKPLPAPKKEPLVMREQYLAAQVNRRI